MPATAVLLCSILGLQNAMVTKILQAELRTTHMTRVITDLGIQPGKLLSWHRLPDSPAEPMVRANRDRLRLHALLLACLAGGGLAGALAFRWLTYYATVPIALLPAGLAVLPILDDLQAGRAR